RRLCDHRAQPRHRRRSFVLHATVTAMIRALILALALVGAAHAQQITPRRIGYFSAGSAEVNAPRLAAFRQGMKALGWVDGKDYIVDARYAEGTGTYLSQLAADVVASRPDVILTP